MVRMLVWLAALLALHARAETLYEQAPLKGSALGLISDSQGQQEGAEIFRLNSSASVEKVSWNGFFFPLREPGTVSFRVSLFRGNLDSVERDPFFSLNVNPMQRVAFTSPSPDSSQHPIYSFEVVLPQPVILAAGEYYWLSVVEQSSPDPNFQWLEGRSGNGFDRWASRTSSGAAWQLTQGQPTDLAFVIEGTTVPEPGTVALMGAGVFFLWRYSERRRNS